MPSTKTRNFHVPVPDNLYQAIRKEAGRRGEPATRLVRELLEQWEQRLRAETLRSEIAEYASREAGTLDDIDPTLEAAGLEAINGQPPAKRPRKAKAK